MCVCIYIYIYTHTHTYIKQVLVKESKSVILDKTVFRANEVERDIT